MKSSITNVFLALLLLIVQTSYAAPALRSHLVQEGASETLLARSPCGCPTSSPSLSPSPSSWEALPQEHSDWEDISKTPLASSSTTSSPPSSWQPLPTEPVPFTPGANPAIASVEVHNKCPFDVRSNIVHAPRPGVKGPPEEILGMLGAWTERSVNGSTGVTSQSRLSHQYEHDPNIGVSWKLSRDDQSGPVQFEWTWVPEQNKVFWDLSMIDTLDNAAYPIIVPGSSSDYEAATEAVHPPPGRPQLPPGIHHPFHPYGISVHPTINGVAVTKEEAKEMGRCTPIRCPEKTGVCWAAYNAWDDYAAQRDCTEEVGLRIVLCG